MKKLRKAVQDYVALRRALGFELREVEVRLLDFVFSWNGMGSPTSPPNVPYSGPHNLPMFSRSCGPSGSVPCAASHDIGAPRSRVRRFRPGACCPTDRCGLDRTSIPKRRSGGCSKPLNLSPPATRCGPGPTTACLEHS